MTNKNKDDNADLFDFIVTPQRVFLIDWSVFLCKFKGTIKHREPHFSRVI